ncbi:MAG TPA: phenylalanine--tRNA ligase subunit beta [Vitreimonas sp.]|uniref:phenylalanine--tRNA ligase subunit beta n=1 Tax=Vitreimonas sp. TaxID=3069702 RepID=UPI002D33993F|nr:phenylalanine--tRNA ligase subunit beta [Vitreimonas sp.]HYD88210.1 phenylalanine--tRNA ligase subunit beta [Vitreimonas sp.]
MKFTLSWLKEHLATDASIAAIVETMTMTGLEVESVENAGEKLAPFTVARIISAAKHPNADKLQVCQVETAQGQLEIVCGAPNARAGLVTAFAPIGTTIPGSGITLEARPVRGVVSNGMLCSGAELELDTDADGILELDPELKVGTPLAEALGLNDPVIDIEVTPNRPDWLGVAGIARDLAAAGIGKQTTKPILPIPGRYPSPQKVATENAHACPMFAGRFIRGVKNGPSPAWLQQRLRAIGQKPISTLVDITNLITHDRGRPLHVYDAGKLSGVVRARMGRDGESFKALNGNVYNVTPQMCVIADDERVLGLGGVIGGEYSGVSETTADILVECALFDPTLTHQTGRALQLTTDAQYRFARGVDSGFVVPGLELATRMILDLCGGEPSEIQVAGAEPAAPQAITFNPDRVRQLAGIDVKPTRVRAVLKDLGFEVTGEGQSSKNFIVQPPTWRRDVEGPADLVEEVARIEGYDKMPLVDPPRAPGFRPPPASVGESRSRLAKRAAASLGYNEAITWSFCSRAQAQAFGGGGEEMLVANPIASDLDCMRPTALPQLLAAAQRNADRGFDDARLFEAGPAYTSTSDSGQQRTLAAIWRARPPRHWRAHHQPDIFDVKRDVRTILEAIGAPVASLQTASEAPAHWRPGRTGALKLGPKVIAYFGEIHPRALKAIDVEAPALAFEIFLDALPAPRAKGRTKPPLEKLDLQPLTRDFAFIVDDGTPAADVVRAAIGADKQLITDVNLFDVYRGERMQPGKKSLAIEVTLQPREKTLTDADIEAASAKIVSAVMKATGGTLRG